VQFAWQQWTARADCVSKGNTAQSLQLTHKDVSPATNVVTKAFELPQMPAALTDLSKQVALCSPYALVIQADQRPSDVCCVERPALAVLKVTLCMSLAGPFDGAGVHAELLMPERAHHTPSDEHGNDRPALGIWQETLRMSLPATLGAAAVEGAVGLFTSQNPLLGM